MVYGHVLAWLLRTEGDILHVRVDDHGLRYARTVHDDGMCVWFGGYIICTLHQCPHTIIHVIDGMPSERTIFRYQHKFTHVCVVGAPAPFRCTVVWFHNKQNSTSTRHSSLQTLKVLANARK